MMTTVSGTSLGYMSASQATLANARYLPSSTSSTYQSSKIASQRPIVTTGEASSMLSVAVYSAQQIVDTVKYLASNARYFNQDIDSQTSAILQENLNNSLQTIDQLAERGSMGSANILSSSSIGITIQSTAYGGKFYVQPQGMDVAGLNLDNLVLYTQEGRTNASSRLISAQAVAEKRLSSLVALQNALGSADGLSGFLRNRGAELSIGTGSLVNLTA
ncbi:MAG: hypothetical protein NUV50_13870 [Rhodospirillales bacterium]|nr:hypothetical protein [Rhodospirillales bacterium]